MDKFTDLALKVDGGGAEQIALIVRLLHGRRRLISHHGFLGETAQSLVCCIFVSWQAITSRFARLVVLRGSQSSVVFLSTKMTS